MRITRRPRTSHFTIVSNDLIEDSRLSFKARGLLVYLLSQPDDWQTDAQRIASQSPDGRSAILSGLKELEQAGYLKRTRSQGERGRWITVCEVSDTPAEVACDKTPDTLAEVTHSEVPDTPTEVRFSDVGPPNSGPPNSGQPDPKERTNTKNPTKDLSPPEIDKDPTKTEADPLFATGSQVAVPRRGRPPGRNAASPQFAEWYQAYPLHKGVGAAEQAYARAVREGADPLVLLQAARRYQGDPQVLQGYVKHPATWLNQKCWLDEDTPQPVAVSRRQQETDALFDAAMRRAQAKEARQ